MPTDKSERVKRKAVEDFLSQNINKPGWNVGRFIQWAAENYKSEELIDLILGWQAHAETRNEWKVAIEEACIVNCIGWDENDAKKSLANLVKWETQIALDPAVSEAAQNLISFGADQATKAHAESVAPAKCNHCGRMWHIDHQHDCPYVTGEAER